MTGAAERDATGVIASAAAGDDVAFGRIVGAHHDDMRRVCVFITRHDALADDAMQAAWAIVWRALGSLREPDRLRVWLTWANIMPKLRPAPSAASAPELPSLEG